MAMVGARDWHDRVVLCSVQSCSLGEGGLDLLTACLQTVGEGKTFASEVVGQ